MHCTVLSVAVMQFLNLLLFHKNNSNNQPIYFLPTSFVEMCYKHRIFLIDK